MREVYVASVAASRVKAFLLAGSVQENKRPNVWCWTYTDEKRPGKEPQGRIQHDTGDDVRDGPEHDLQDDTGGNVSKHHAALAVAVRRFRQQQAAQEASAVEAGRGVAHAGQVAFADADEVFDDPA